MKIEIPVTAAEEQRRLKLSVCTDAVYAGIPTGEAAEDVLRRGFEAIEFWGWWDKDLSPVQRLHEEQGLTVAAFCTRFISLVDEKCRGDYVAALKETLDAAGRLGTKVIISQTGNDLGTDRAGQRRCMAEGLKECAPLLEEAGVTLAVEPLNLRVDHAGYFLSSSDECADILAEVGSPNVKMLFDVYHQQITEGDICRRIGQHLPLIAHFHTAGNPGRHELYSSELDYAKVFETIRETGYEGYVGLEYMPADEVGTGLAFAKELF